MRSNLNSSEISFANNLDILLKEAKQNNGIEVFESDILYHYTSFEGLRGIVGNNKNSEQGGLWFTRYDCLNDKSEGIDFWEMYNRVLDSMIDDTSVPNLVKRIRDYRDDRFTFIQNGQLINDFGDYYICCFCEDNDNLPMWNYYGNDGYCLGISKLSIRSVFHIAGFSSENMTRPRLHDIRHVIYDEEKKCKIISQFIGGIVDWYNKYDLDEERKWYIIQSKLSSFIGHFKLIFKNQHYKYENEIRAIAIVPKEYNNDFCLDILGEKKYRERAGMIVPYFDCRGRYQINSVNIAPKNITDDERKRNECILTDFLLSKGYENISVTTSKIPVRF